MINDKFRDTIRDTGDWKFIHNDKAYNDLEIGSHIFEKIDNTVTKFGKKKLANRLKYRYHKLSDLTDMVNTNQMIYRDTVYVDEIGELLKNIATIEDKVDGWMIQDCEKSLLFDYNLLNNRLLLTVSNKMKFSNILILIFFYVFIFLYLNYIDMPISITDYGRAIVTGYRQFAKLIVSQFMNNRKWIENTAILLTVLYIGYQCYMMYQTVNGCYEHYNKCTDFYEHYDVMIDYLDICEQIYNSDKYFRNKKIMESIKYLRYYFTEGSSLGFSLVSKTLTNDYIEHMNIITNYIGRIDYHIAIVRLIDSQYTIPKFVQSTFPILKINDMWNPIIEPAKRVPNSVTIDISTSNLMILTGPNKAGKSTFMKSLMVNVYLAHSIGIACCQSIELTPYRNMYTYMNVPDCIGRESLFEAEINRCFEYIESIEDFKGFSIGAIDELFTGTNPKEGMAGSYAIIKRIVNVPVSITIMSTHFHDMLKQLINEDIIFKKFTASKNIDNNNDVTYNFDYKIKNGISNQCIALELIKEKGFDKEIVSDALTFMKTYNKK